MVAADRRAVWDALVDPALVADLTPFVRRVTADGEHWLWELSGLDVLGVKLAPAFTERMVFTDGERIEYHHEPPEGTTERAGVNGWYSLADAEDGTRLGISLGVEVDLPLPRVSAPAVTTAMKGVMATMGERFSRNLLAHLGA